MRQLRLLTPTSSRLYWSDQNKDRNTIVVVVSRHAGVVRFVGLCRDRPSVENYVRLRSRR
jgi:hypothetical protein